jgi:hypothetical protein
MKAKESKQRREDYAAAQFKKRIEVGVDFVSTSAYAASTNWHQQGTTFSGVSYISNANQQNLPEVITSWTDGQKAFQEKVPTVYAYADENGWAKDKWGYGIEPNAKKYSWFKLLLDDHVEPADWDDKLLKGVIGEGLLDLPKGKTAVDVTTDYLRALYYHILNFFENELTARALLLTPLTFCLTVP